MIRCCPCGHPIRGKAHLCQTCHEIYGEIRAEWPEWLKFMVNDIEREYSYECRVERREDQLCENTGVNK